MYKMLGVLILASIILASCLTKAPYKEINEAQDAMRNAVKANAPQYAPKEFESAQEAMDRATNDLVGQDFNGARHNAKVASELAYFAKIAAIRNKDCMDDTLLGEESITESNLDAGLKALSLADEQEAADSFKDSSVSEGLLAEFDEAGLKVIYFDFDQYQIKKDQEQNVSKNINFLKKYDNVNLLVEGHCDVRGSNEYNLALGQKRAYAIQDFFDKNGISQKRVKLVSFGEERPALIGSGEDIHSKNRRVEFQITD
ncbi:MAG: OmpA family protein [Pseudomonadota bacterium]